MVLHLLEAKPSEDLHLQQQQLSKPPSIVTSIAMLFIHLVSLVFHQVLMEVESAILELGLVHLVPLVPLKQVFLLVALLLLELLSQVLQQAILPVGLNLSLITIF